MDVQGFHQLVQSIVEQACQLKDRHTAERGVPVNYACFFSKSQSEFDELYRVAGTVGKVVKRTNSGDLFQVTPIQTVAGLLQIVKVRIPDSTKPERGDADFTLPDYPTFKQEHLGKAGFKLIERDYMEMIELMEPGCNVRAYFSYPPLDQQLGITAAGR